MKIRRVLRDHSPDARAARTEGGGAMSAPTVCMGYPRVVVEPLRVEIVHTDTLFGSRYTICARDDRGDLQSLHRDALGCSIRYVSLECARRALWRSAAKWIAQGIGVILDGEPEE